MLSLFIAFLKCDGCSISQWPNGRVGFIAEIFKCGDPCLWSILY